MRLNVHEIDEVAKQLVCDESTASLNEQLMHGGVRDYVFHAPVSVRLEYYRAGQELFVQGHITGTVYGQCARCVEEYAFGLERDFSVVLVPKPDVPTDAELGDEDLDFSSYEGDTVDLSPLIREQMILALPTRPLCEDNCKGLCPQCGINRNLHTCQCHAASADPRLAPLRNLKLTH